MTIDQLIEQLIEYKVHSITLIKTVGKVIRVTRHGSSDTFLVTLGKPNYKTRKYIKRHPSSVGTSIAL